jgi:hypothetical protein
VPGIVLVHGLEIVGAKHQQHKRQRRVDLNPLFQTQQSIAAWLIRIFPDGTPPVQSVFYDSDRVPIREECFFHHSRPPFMKGQPLARVWNNPPGQRIRVHQNLVHGRKLKPAISIWHLALSHPKKCSGLQTDTMREL